MNHLTDPFRFLAGAARGLPQQVSFYITGNCNARCSTCFYWESLNIRRAELKTDEFCRIAEKIWPFQILYLTGGEPFLRRDLPEICEAFGPKARTIHLFSNSLLPDRLEDYTRRILDVCPDTRIKVSLSLDGLGQVHDGIRGVSGNFEKFLEGNRRLGNLREEYPRLRLNIISTLAKNNAAYLPETIAFVRENLEVDTHGINLARGNSLDPSETEVTPDEYEATVRALDPAHAGLSNRLRTAVTREMHDVILKTVKEQREVIPCLAGRQVIVIDEVGDVTPCELIRREMGNVRQADYDLRKILRSSRATDARRDIRDTQCHCTHECFVQANIVHTPSRYPRLLRRMWNHSATWESHPNGDGKECVETVRVLGTGIRVMPRKKVLAKVQSFLGAGPRSVFIANARTANLGYLDLEYRNCLNRADLVLNDGTGIRWAARMRGVHLRHNHVGTDLVPWLLENLDPPGEKLRVFLLGGRERTVQRAAEAIVARFPGVEVVGWNHGFFMDEQGASVAESVRASGSDLCLVGMGNPVQEIWIDRNRERVGSTVMIGVGGLFDYLSGEMRRAPRIFRRNGFEWGYIVLRQPFKWRRYFVDNPMFLLRTMREALENR